MLHEERHALRLALVSDRPCPVEVHRPGSVAALSSDDHPADAGEVELAKVFEQRFEREEPNAGRGLAELIEAPEDGLIFDRRSLPYVRKVNQIAPVVAPFQNRRATCRPLREDLEYMLRS